MFKQRNYNVRIKFLRDLLARIKNTLEQDMTEERDQFKKPQQ